jgi:hypothetical protein
MLGQYGWLQTTNLVLSGLMTLAAALGLARGMRGPRELGHPRAGTWAAALTGLYGISLLGSAVFPPDPAGGFPPGARQTGSASGIAHLTFGALAFLGLAGAALATAIWFDLRRKRVMTRYSRASAAVVAAGFLGGAALASIPLGVALLWVAVLSGWAWLLITSLQVYLTVPHPDARMRRPARVQTRPARHAPEAPNSTGHTPAP